MAFLFSDDHFKITVRCPDESCYYSLPPSSPPYNPFLNLTPPINDQRTITMDDPSHKAQHLIVLALTICSALALFTLLFIYYIVFIRLRSYLRRRRLAPSTASPSDPSPQNADDHDHDHDDVHHIWYIRTVGLEQPAIDSITVCAYKAGEGLIDGTDCSVCLTEFREGELVRLLPKCSHAFHVQCIDTWLRAHVNCPLCRAPILSNAPVGADGADQVDGGVQEDDDPSLSSSTGRDPAVLFANADGEEDGSEENRIGFFPDLGSSSSSGGLDRPIGLLRDLVGSEGRQSEEDHWVTIDLNCEGDLQQQQVRRSVSMDASAMGELMNIEITAKEVGGVQMDSPQKGPDGVDRCQSTNGRKFFLPRFARIRSTSILPL